MSYGRWICFGFGKSTTFNWSNWAYSSVVVIVLLVYFIDIKIKRRFLWVRAPDTRGSAWAEHRRSGAPERLYRKKRKFTQKKLYRYFYKQETIYFTMQNPYQQQPYNQAMYSPQMMQPPVMPTPPQLFNNMPSYQPQPPPPQQPQQPMYMPTNPLMQPPQQPMYQQPPPQQLQPTYFPPAPVVEPPPTILLQMAQYAPSIIEFIMAGKRVCRETGKSETKVDDVIKSMLAMFSHIVSYPLDKFPPTNNTRSSSELDAGMQQIREKIEATKNMIAEQEMLSQRLKSISEQVVRDYNSATQAATDAVYRQASMNVLTQNMPRPQQIQQAAPAYPRPDAVPYQYNGKVDNEYTAMQQMPPGDQPLPAQSSAALMGTHRFEAPSGLESRAVLTLRSNEVADRVPRVVENYHAADTHAYSSARAAPQQQQQQLRAHMPYVPMTADDQETRSLRVEVPVDEIPDEDMDRIRRHRARQVSDTKSNDAAFKQALQQERESIKREREMLKKEKEAQNMQSLEKLVLDVLTRAEATRKEIIGGDTGSGPGSAEAAPSAQAGVRDPNESE
jgi:hypothetical protein